jgi:DNA polymerase-3 subunit beta
MKFRCERDVFLEALATAGRAVSSRGGSSPMLSCVNVELLGDRLVLLGTDTELSIEVEVAVAGFTDGVALIPARLLTDIVRALGAGAVEVDVSGEMAVVSSGRSEFSLRHMPIEDFPRPALLDTAAIDVDARALGQALRQVVPAASSDDSRPVLTGVLMAAEAGGLRLVATDSYRLAQRDLSDTRVLDEGQSVLLPSRALSELTRLLAAATAAGSTTVAVRLGDRAATFDCGNSRLTTRLIEGDFPNYRNLVPTSCPNRLTVGRDVLLDAVRRVRLLARDATSTPIRLAQSADGLELRAITQDVGEAHESVDAQYSGTDLTVAFNPEFLVNGLEAMVGDEVVLETEDTRKPAVLRGVGHDEFLYLLMPVRVS